MKQVIVGRYDLGGETVEVALREGIGGDWNNRTPEKKMALIRVGVGDLEDWPGAVGILLHEAAEFVKARMGLRFRPGPDYAADNGGYLFVATHTQFSEAMARVGDFLARCLPDLSLAWQRWKKGDRKG